MSLADPYGAVRGVCCAVGVVFCLQRVAVASYSGHICLNDSFYYAGII